MKHHLLTTTAAVVLVGCGEPLIHDAAKEGNIEAVKQHLAAGVDVNEDSYGGTPLQGAARRGHNSTVELLIAEGADVNAKGGYHGLTPLNYASGWGHKEIVELLIAGGADVNAKDKVGTPLDLAISRKRYEIIAILRKHGGKTGKEFSIHVAAESGNIEAVKQHIAAGTDVNVKDGVGTTPLHNAVGKGHKEIAELLISEGADVNAKNDFGVTPLDVAIWIKKNTPKSPPKIIDLLRKHGGKTGKELKAEGK